MPNPNVGLFSAHAAQVCGSVIAVGDGVTVNIWTSTYDPLCSTFDAPFKDAIEAFRCANAVQTEIVSNYYNTQRSLSYVCVEYDQASPSGESLGVKTIYSLSNCRNREQMCVANRYFDDASNLCVPCPDSGKTPSNRVYNMQKYACHLEPGNIRMIQDPIH